MFLTIGDLEENDINDEILETVEEPSKDTLDLSTFSKDELREYYQILNKKILENDIDYIENAMTEILDFENKTGKKANRIVNPKTRKLSTKNLINELI